MVLSATTLIRYIGDFLSTLFVLLFSRSQLEEQDPLIEDTVTPPEEPSTEIPTETSTEQTPPPEDSSPKDSDL
ncbi:MAG: hypothetical protein KME15_14705 [Drouetiella hepatica Uher 2000/2452]|uniref:Uncharacterized protein n=1 Tax=Drouetiella hepatica Uher 2000/2452 TaxID=904376 RepID=A0A951QAX1_9CYAN|nr:hypothetical protein [Drouetiella hepatica Uher 2000/2452]